MVTPKTWSYSALSLFEECPKRYYHVKLVKDVADPKSPALFNGLKVHREGEDYLRTPSITTVPKSFATFERLMQDLKTLNPYVELKIGINSNWTVNPKGWSGAWMLGAYDATVVYNDEPKHVDMIDFKTGKRYDSNDEQLELYALTAFLKWKPETVGTRLWYVDSGLEIVNEFRADQVPTLLSKWDAKARRLFNETAWNAKPSDKCKWCPVPASKCRFGRSA